MCVALSIRALSPATQTCIASNFDFTVFCVSTRRKKAARFQPPARVFGNGTAHLARKVRVPTLNRCYYDAVLPGLSTKPVLCSSENRSYSPSLVEAEMVQTYHATSRFPSALAAAMGCWYPSVVRPMLVLPRSVSRRRIAASLSVSWRSLTRRKLYGRVFGGHGIFHVRLYNAFQLTTGRLDRERLRE